MTDRDDLLRRVRRANPAPVGQDLPAGIADSRPPLEWLIEGKYAMAATTRSEARRRGLIAAAAGVAVVVAVVLAVLFWPQGSRTVPFVEEGSTIPGTTVTVPTTLTPSTTVTTIASTTVAATGEPGVVASRPPASAFGGVVEPLWVISAQEVWTGNPFCRLRDGAWTCFGPTPKHPVLDLAATADGTVWVATSDGVFSFDGAEWSRRFDGPTGAVAVDTAGTVWIGGYMVGDPGGYARWLARWDGQDWVRLDPHPERAPVPSDYMRLAVTPDGEAWIGGFVYVGCARGEPGAARYDGTIMREAPLPGPECTWVYDLAAAPNGDLWAILIYGNQPSPRVARFDGADWTVFPPALVQLSWGGVSRGGDLAVGPDGVVWVVCETGLCSYDGTAWTVRVEEREIAAVDVAPDGTVWYSDQTRFLHTLTP